MKAQTIVNKLLETVPDQLFQSFLTPDRRYFNFKLKGQTSTTWNWDDLLKLHPEGIEVLGWWVDPQRKTAINMADHTMTAQLE